MGKLIKPRVSILNPQFKYTKADHTDVGRHLRAHLRAQRRPSKPAPAVVPIKRRASC